MPRKIKVTTVSMPAQAQNSVAQNRQRALTLLDAACAHRPDLVCLPETIENVGQEFGGNSVAVILNHYLCKTILMGKANINAAV